MHRRSRTSCTPSYPARPEPEVEQAAHSADHPHRTDGDPPALIGRDSGTQRQQYQPGNQPGGGRDGDWPAGVVRGLSAPVDG